MDLWELRSCLGEEACDKTHTMPKMRQTIPKGQLNDPGTSTRSTNKSHRNHNMEPCPVNPEKNRLSSPVRSCWKNIVVIVNRNPDIGSFFILNFNAIWIALVPTFQDLSFGEFPNVGINGVSNLESKLLGLAVK